MPKIKIDHVISFSSEDPVHVANNILSSDTSKKWKCLTPGEKNAVVVLQLEKASLITGIDIGNEHSAYVEVLASRSGTNEDYKVLLVTSAFMTPLESRQSNNVNKVRMFTKDNFSKPECDEKWDRVKIICTQPFNRHVQYGLSFINLHTGEGKPTGAVQAHIGKFLIRPESPDNISAGSLFEKRKELKQEEKLTGAAAIREASSSSSLAMYGSPVCKPKLKTSENLTKTPMAGSKRDSLESTQTPSKPRNRNELLYSKDEEEPNQKIDKIIESKTKDKELKLENETPAKRKADAVATSSKKEKRVSNTGSLDVSIASPSSSKGRNKADENERKRKNKDVTTKDQNKKRKKGTKVTKPFPRLLEGVTLVISGIQNPDRGKLRSYALSMGANYKPDWDNTCTHLICAFTNTPKFRQVKGKGKIVRKNWIEDCHSERKRLPWRRYALDKNDAGKESEEEICEETEPDLPVASDSENDFNEHKDEASDTEERIAKIQEAQRIKNKQKVVTNVYNVDTDEEEPLRKASSTLTCKLKNFFDKKKFYIDHAFDDEVYNRLQKYIAAYDGKSIEDPTDNIDVIVTRKENSETLKEVNNNAVCLGPAWIWECHNSQKLVPFDEYVY